jgi:pimeloyl-ACP methyl ester carboxylesterase
VLGLASPAVFAPAPKPKIVLVHGAFAESASWNGVIAALMRRGYHVTAAANPLRGVAGDAAYVDAVVRSTLGPVILVGHSYAGAVISGVAADNVRALVFVSAFAPEVGESLGDLIARFPVPAFSAALARLPLLNGDVDLVIRQDSFPAVLAPDVPLANARLMAAEQRPVSQRAFTEKASRAAWKTVPCWYVYGSKDRAIAPGAMAFMAERAGARQVVVIPGSSHLAPVSHPLDVAEVIEEAAAAA